MSKSAIEKNTHERKRGSMFTGLIEGKGKVFSFSKKGNDARFEIIMPFPSSTIKKGDSIAVNGVCLTVESFSAEHFVAYVSEETFSKSNLVSLSKGDTVNLERALAVGERFGGHIVSGHVDCLAEVILLEQKGESTLYRLSFPKEFSQQIVGKGSIALDGISLTVNICTDNYFEVNIIPTTSSHTTIATWKKGTLVNMETDVLAKYVEKMLFASQEKVQKTSSISAEFLQKNGFM